MCEGKSEEIGRLMRSDLPLGRLEWRSVCSSVCVRVRHCRQEWSQGGKLASTLEKMNKEMTHFGGRSDMTWPLF